MWGVLGDALLLFGPEGTHFSRLGFDKRTAAAFLLSVTSSSKSCSEFMMEMCPYIGIYPAALPKGFPGQGFGLALSTSVGNETSLKRQWRCRTLIDAHSNFVSLVQNPETRSDPGELQLRSAHPSQQAEQRVGRNLGFPPRPRCVPVVSQVLPVITRTSRIGLNNLHFRARDLISWGADCAIEVAGVEESAAFCSPALRSQAGLIYPEELIETTELSSEKGHTASQRRSEHLHNLCI